MKEPIGENQGPKIEEEKPETQSELPEALDVNLDPKLVEEIEKEAEAGLEELDHENTDKKHGWGEPVEGEVEIDGEKVKVRYREKVITLPERRRKETGVTRIRRRELLPPLPENFGKIERKGHGFNDWKKWDEALKFLTDDRYPSEKLWTHIIGGQRDVLGEKGKGERGLFFKAEGLYFQTIFSGDSADYYKFRDGEMVSVKDYSKPIEGGEIGKMGIQGLSCWVSRPWVVVDDTLKKPLFVFGHNNKNLVDYIDSIHSNKEVGEMLDQQEYALIFKPEFVREKLELLKNGQPADKQTGVGRELFIPIVHHPDIKPLRWCHSELGFIPTKRGLNVLFFETGNEDKKDDEIASSPAGSSQ